MNCYKNAGSYSDAAQRVGEPYYKQAEALLVAGNVDGAITAFKNAGTYNNAATRWKTLYYQKGERLASEKKWREATAAFFAAAGYKDALARGYAIAYKHMGWAKIADIQLNSVFCVLINGKIEVMEYNRKEDKGFATLYDYKTYSDFSGNDWIAIVSYTEYHGKLAALKSDGTCLEEMDKTWTKNIAAIFSGNGNYCWKLSSVDYAKVGAKDMEGYNEDDDPLYVVQRDYSKGRIWDKMYVFADGTLRYECGNKWKVKDGGDLRQVIKVAGFAALNADGTVACFDGKWTYPSVREWTDVIDICTYGKYEKKGVVFGLKGDGTVAAATYNYTVDVTDWHDITAIGINKGYVIGLQSDGTVLYAKISETK